MVRLIRVFLGFWNCFNLTGPISGLASIIHNIYLWRTLFLRTLVMMRMRVGLKHVLNDPVSLIYTPVIFSLI